jgi:hypothetical protein
VIRDDEAAMIRLGFKTKRQLHLASTMATNSHRMTQYLTQEWEIMAVVMATLQCIKQKSRIYHEFADVTSTHSLCCRILIVTNACFTDVRQKF